MIADTTFLSRWVRERTEQRGPAHAFLAAHRPQVVRTSIISAGEVAVMFDEPWQVWEALRPWKIYRLHAGIVDAAASIDRALMAEGARLGENDNWIAGFCLYYRQPLVSLDQDFDRVEGLHRLAY